MKYRTILAAAALLGFSLAINAQELERVRLEAKMVGPGAGGYMFGVWVRPGEPDYIVTGGDMGNSFWSEDGGKTWKFANPDIASSDSPSGCSAVCFDHRDRNRVWLGSSQGVYVTEDHYKTWRSVTPRGFALKPHTLVQDPKDGDILWVGCGAQSQSLGGLGKGPLARTTDGGKTWAKIESGGFPTNPGVREIVIEPTSEFQKGLGHRQVFAATEEGIYATDDFGATWRRSDKGIAPGFKSISDLKRIVKDKRPRYFAGVWYEVTTNSAERPPSIFYVSDDLCRTWQPGSVKGLLDFNGTNYMDHATWNNRGAQLSFCETDPDVVWMASWWKLFRSVDGGRNWTRVKNWYKQYYDAMIDGRKFIIVKNNPESNADSGWAAAAECTERVTATADPLVAYATDQIYATRDGGKSWKAMFDTSTQDAQGRRWWKCNGVNNLMGQRVTTDPADWKKVYMGYNDVGLAFSFDGGETTYLTQAAENRMAANMSLFAEAYALLYDPVARRIWVSQMLEGRQQPGRRDYCHIYASDDGGFHFNRVGREDLDGLVTGFAANPDSPEFASSGQEHFLQGRELYVAAAGKGIYRSADSGSSWILLPTGPMGAQPLTTAVEYGRGGVLFALVGGKGVVFSHVIEKLAVKLYGTDGKLDSHSGLYRSYDTGRTWERVGAKELGDLIYRVRIHPVASNVVYCTAKEGLYKSVDQGQTWARIYDSLPHTGFIALDLHPTDPGVVYFSQQYSGPMTDEQYASRPYGLYRTLDGGKSFAYIAGVPGKTIADIRVCPDNPRMIYLATTSAGFYRLEDNSYGNK